MSKWWIGPVPEKCDICHEKPKDVFYDARTIHGSWAIMCSKCFKARGICLGTGYGQKYRCATGEKIGG
uniref:Uncharacterized protein n=1 Tax=viral metagenome TaxID=1070528 RepID=A0A6M3LTL4_9ZZZZ